MSAPKIDADPVLVEIVAGTLAAIEKEVETSIGRTSRSPMIRDAHDFRAGIHDRQLRKLTGRSYSALVHPVVRDYPIETMNVGDVFFHNDVYLSEGGIGHLPDLCVTVPVFHQGEVVAFVQAFGHHDDIGGAVPGSMPSHATSVFEEGLMVPPIRLWDAGVPNEAALKIMTRNSRMPDSLAADLDDPAVTHADVGTHPRRTGAIDHVAAADEQVSVSHALKLPLNLVMSNRGPVGEWPSGSFRSNSPHHEFRPQKRGAPCQM